MAEWIVYFPTDCVVACVNLQVTPQRDTCKCEHHPRTGVLFSINLTPTMMLMVLVIAVYC